MKGLENTAQKWSAPVLKKRKKKNPSNNKKPRNCAGQRKLKLCPAVV
jgi:hypothetical protein